MRAHIFLCMLAYYVQWHLRQTWAPYLFGDQHPGQHADDSVVRPALRSASALAKAHTQRTPDSEDVHSFATLLAHLSSVVHNEVVVPAHPEIAPFAMITTPDSLQSKLFHLVGLEVHRQSPMPVPGATEHENPTRRRTKGVEREALRRSHS